MGSVRVCYLWEMGLMVKTAELERMREKRIKELEQRRQDFTKKYQITKKPRKTSSRNVTVKKSSQQRGCER